MKGRVITGDRIGRTLSFPTANVHYPQDIIKVSRGVYATLVEFDSKVYKAITNYGKRPTVDGSHSLILESHLIDFKDNIYDKDIKISFVKKLRDEKKFPSLPDLKSQLVKDEQQAVEYFDAHKM